MNTTFKKFAAAFTASIACTGAAFAEEPHTIDNTALLENIYAAMDADQKKTFSLVMASIEVRMAVRLAKIENLDAPAPLERFILASN